MCTKQTESRGEQVYQNIIYFITDIFCVLIFLTGLYYTAIGFFSLFGRHSKSVHIKMHRFAVVIPAHNEAEVIDNLLLSIKMCSYPQSLISVYVIADGCSDPTAHRARILGANVITRPFSTCKGDALCDAFSVLLNDTEFDAVAVFDADNIVHPDFFSAMNERLSSGAEAVQGYIDAKNADSSWVAYAHSTWYWLTNRLMQAGRGVLGIGCKLEGTGFVLSLKLLDRIKWQTVTFAEDAEYTCRLAENGVFADYAPNAVVFDEKPTRFKESVMQRRRWAKGIFDVQSEYTLRLLRRGRFNTLMTLWGDVLAPVAFVVLTLSVFVINHGIWQSIPGRITLWLYIFINILIMLLALVKDRKISVKMILNIFGFLIYIISWLPVCLFGVLGRNKDGWHHTKHNNIS